MCWDRPVVQRWVMVVKVVVRPVLARAVHTSVLPRTLEVPVRAVNTSVVPRILDVEGGFCYYPLHKGGQQFV